MYCLYISRKLIHIYMYIYFSKKNCCCFIGVLVKPWLVVVYSGFVLAAKLTFLSWDFSFFIFFLAFRSYFVSISSFLFF